MKNFLSLIKFSHTIFALPFAMVGFFIAHTQLGNPIDYINLFYVLLCMVFARSAAMAFNRYLDRDIDVLNPRTAGREIPAGVISASSALLFVVINVALFIFTAWLINPLCFYLSPIAIIIVLGYSYTKRFTFLCHFVLGLGLALAPLGAYLAAGGGFDLLPILYAVVVLLWVSGFDIIYALQDDHFDRANQLQSIPVKLGRRNALWLSGILHFCCALVIVLASYYLSLTDEGFGWLQWTGTAIFIGLLIYQHMLIRPDDLSRVNLAFFTTNGFASLILGTLVVLDFFF